MSPRFLEALLEPLLEPMLQFLQLPGDLGETGTHFVAKPGNRRRFELCHFFLQQRQAFL